MSVTESLKKAFRNPILAPLGGLLLTGVAVGGILLVFQLVVVPLWRPQERGGAGYRGETFTLWYRDDSPARGGHAELARTLDRELEDLTGFLGVDPSLIPGEIDVFVHDSVQAMRASIFSRKGGGAIPTYRPALDLLASEAPRPRLAELVLAFGWGRSTSQILQIGTALYAAAPDRNYHAFVAALPDRLFLSPFQLIRLEEANRLPVSLYQRVDAPYAPAAVGDLADLKALLRLSADKADPADLSTWEIASLVQFIVEEFGGMASLRSLWGEGPTEKALRTLVPGGLAAFAAQWKEAASRRGGTSPELPYLQAVYLLASGDPDAAFAETQRWSLSGLSAEHLLVAGRCACVVGAFADAARAAERLAVGESRSELEGLIGLYQGWGVAERDRIRVLSSDPSAAALETLALSVEQACESVSRSLGLSPAQLPPRLTVFVYPDQASRDQGATLAPLGETRNAVLHLAATEDVAFRVAQVLPTYAWVSDSYSRLLREGLAAALTRDEGALIEEACRLRSYGRWVPLRAVDFGSAEPAVVWVEAGLLLQYLLASGGPEGIRAVWTATSPEDRFVSFDRALAETYGMRREELETALVGSVLRCNGR
jgi:hypothetical protein